MKQENVQPTIHPINSKKIYNDLSISIKAFSYKFLKLNTNIYFSTKLYFYVHIWSI